MNVCDKSSSFKCFEDYRMITNPTSKAFNYIKDNMVIDNQNGLLKTKDGEFVGVAMSSRYGTIGDKFKIELSSGQTFKCVLVDIKSNRHLKNACSDSSGAMIEFVVDTDLIDEKAWQSGSFDFMFNGTIERIYKYHE